MYILSKEDHVFIIQNFSLKLKMQKVPQIKSDNHHEIPPLFFGQDRKYSKEKNTYINYIPYRRDIFEPLNRTSSLLDWAKT